LKVLEKKLPKANGSVWKSAKNEDIWISNIIDVTRLTCADDWFYLLCLQAPMAVIGLTCRMDAISLFEKRVRSRFSHRQIYLLTKPDFDNFTDNFERLLCIEAEKGLKTIYARNWNKSIQDLMADPSVEGTLKKIFNLNSKFRFLQNILVLILTSHLEIALRFVFLFHPSRKGWLNLLFLCRQFVAVSRLDDEHPFLSAKDIVAAYESQTADCKTLQLQGLSVLELQLVKDYSFNLDSELVFYYYIIILFLR